MSKEIVDKLGYELIGCAIEVHKFLGPGLLEKTYEKCFMRELEIRGINFHVQQSVPLSYKGIHLDTDLRLDVIVEDLIIVELKSIDGFLPIHTSVLLTYMKMLKKPKGILINFNCVNIFKEGQKTLVNEYYTTLGKN